MKIASVNNTNCTSLGFKKKMNSKNLITNDLIRRVNQRMIETGGKSRELSPLEKFADIMLDKSIKEIPQELNSAKDEFDALSKNEQDRLLLFAKCRKSVRELVSDRERLNSAFKKAWDSVVWKK